MKLIASADPDDIGPMIDAYGAVGNANEILSALSKRMADTHGICPGVISQNQERKLINFILSRYSLAGGTSFPITEEHLVGSIRAIEFLSAVGSIAALGRLKQLKFKTPSTASQRRLQDAIVASTEVWQDRLNLNKDRDSLLRRHDESDNHLLRTCAREISDGNPPSLLRPLANYPVPLPSSALEDSELPAEQDRSAP